MTMSQTPSDVSVLDVTISISIFYHDGAGCSSGADRCGAGCWSAKECETLV